MKVPCGRVLGIHSANRRPYVCTLQMDEKGTQPQHSGLVVPWDSRIPKIRLKTRQVINQLLLSLTVLSFRCLIS